MANAFETNTATVSWTSAPVDAIKARYNQYKVYRQTLRELAGLSDRALADLGLSRSMIRSVAREAAYGA